MMITELLKWSVRTELDRSLTFWEKGEKQSHRSLTPGNTWEHLGTPVCHLTNTPAPLSQSVPARLSRRLRNKTAKLVSNPETHDVRVPVYVLFC